MSAASSSSNPSQDMPQTTVQKRAQTLGALIVISGPSGVGKGTLCRRLIEEYPEQLVWSVSATSRQPRPGEVDGKDYYFLSPDDFKAGVEKGEFLEWAEYNGKFYGTPRKLVQETRETGMSVLLEIDVQGAKQVRQAISQGSEGPENTNNTENGENLGVDAISDVSRDATLVFIAPPSMDALKERLIGRGTNTPEDMERRLAISAEEMTQQHHFNHVVVNDDLEACYQRLKKLLLN